MKSEPEDGQGHWFGVFGCRVTQGPCKQEHPGALPHPSHELGVGNQSDLTQLFHYNNSFLPEIHIVLYLPGPTSDPALGPPSLSHRPWGSQESDLKGFRTGIFVVGLGRSCWGFPHFSQGQKCPVPLVILAPSLDWHQFQGSSVN